MRIAGHRDDMRPSHTHAKKTKHPRMPTVHLAACARAPQPAAGWRSGGVRKMGMDKHTHVIGAHIPLTSPSPATPFAACRPPPGCYMHHLRAALKETWRVDRARRAGGLREKCCMGAQCGWVARSIDARKGETADTVAHRKAFIDACAVDARGLVGVCARIYSMGGCGCVLRPDLHAMHPCKTTV